MEMIQKEKLSTYIRSHKITSKSIATIRSALAKPNNKKPRANHTDYLLYAQCLIYQLEQEHKYQALKVDFLTSQAKQILQLLKKCSGDDKIKILLKLLSLFEKEKVEPVQEMEAFFQELVTKLAKLGEQFSNKFIDFVVMDRLDEILIYLVRNFKEQQKVFKQKIKAILSGITGNIQKIKRSLPNDEFQEVFKNIHILQLKQKSMFSKQRVSKEKSIKISDRSKQSLSSVTSERSEVYLERLRKFDETNEIDSNRKEYLLIQMNKKKKRSFLRVSEKLMHTPKRISNSWARTPLVSTFSNYFIERRNSKIEKNETKKQVETEQRSQTSERQASFQKISVRNSESQKTQKNYYFSPFYFFACVKGCIKCLEATNADIEQVGSFIKMRVDVIGYFTQKIIIKKSCFSIKNQMLKDQFAGFIVGNMKISRPAKGIWEVLTPQMNKLSNSQNKAKKYEKMILYNDPENVLLNIYFGFIAIENVKFFAKFSWKASETEGTFLILQKNCENIVEQFPLSKKKAFKYFKHSSNVKRNEMTICSPIEYEVSNFSSTEKQMQVSQETFTANHIKNKSFYNNKTKSNRNKSQIFELVKVNGCFRLLSQKIKRNQKTLFVETTSETMHDINNLDNLRLSYKYSQSENFTSSLNRLTRKMIENLTKKPNQFKSVIGRRCKTPYLSFVELQFNFTVKVLPLKGYFLCKIIVFKRSSSDLILLEGYHQHLQKYYQLQINSNIISCMFHSISFKQMAVSELQSLFFCIKKEFKIRVSSLEESCNELKLEFEWKGNKIQFQELICREYSVNKSKNPTKIYCMFKSKQEITAVPELKITLRQGLFFVGKKIQNSGWMDHEIIKKDVLLQTKYRYNELIKDANEIMRKNLLILPEKQFYSYHYFDVESKEIMNAKRKKEAWSLDIQKGRVLQTHQLSIEKLYGCVWSKLPKKSLKRVLRRTLRDNFSRRIVIG